MTIFHNSENISEGSKNTFDYKSLGERIEISRGREKQGIMAKKLGKPQSYISKIENGSQKPTPEDIFSICNIYSINEKWLISGEGPMKAEGEQNEKIDETDKSIRDRNEYEAFVNILCSAFERVVREGEGENRKKIINDVMDYINELGPNENK